MSSRIGTFQNRQNRHLSSFEDQLKRQHAFLKKSAHLFDEGDEDEAIRLATTTRVLLHDTRNQTSLLTHLGIKNALMFVDTGVYRERLDAELQKWVCQVYGSGAKISAVTLGEAGLVEMGIGKKDGKIGWYAPLRERRFKPGCPPDLARVGPQRFAEWWDTPLVESSTRQYFSRAHLVTIMANQDGGAHVDATLDADYNDLCVDFLGTQLEISDAPFDPAVEIPTARNNVAFASMRQIAFELILTIDRYLAVKENPGILALANPYDCIGMPIAPHHNPGGPGFQPPIVISNP